MLTFNVWQTTVSGELAQLLSEKFAEADDQTVYMMPKKRRVAQPAPAPAPEQQTRVIPPQAAPPDQRTRVIPRPGVSNTGMSQVTRSIIDSTRNGQRALGAAVANLDNGMVHIGRIVSAANDTDINDARVKDALQTIARSLTGDGSRPLGRIARLIDEIEAITATLGRVPTHVASSTSQQRP